MTPTLFRAVVTDLDGTIVGDDGRLSDLTVAAAQELKRIDVPMIVATARTPFGITAIEHLPPLVAIAVCCTGAIGWSPTTSANLWTHVLEIDTARRIAEILARFDRPGFASFESHQWRMTADYVGFRGASPRGPTEMVPLGAVVENAPCALAACVPGLSASHIAAELRDRGISEAEATLTWAADELLDIVPPGVDKATGVDQALKILDIGWDSTITFGDMPNDLPMLRSSAVAVAAEEGHLDVKAAADLIASKISEDGFARTLGEIGVISKMP